MITVVTNAFLINAYHLGLDRHAFYVPSANIPETFKWLWAAEPTNLFAVFLVRLSIALFFLRLVPPKSRYIWTIWAVIGILTISDIYISINFFFECRPIRKVWLPSTPGSCFSDEINHSALWLFQRMICGSIPTLRPLVLRWQKEDSKDEGMKLNSYGKRSPKIGLGPESRYSAKSGKAFVRSTSKERMVPPHDEHRILQTQDIEVSYKAAGPTGENSESSCTGWGAINLGLGIVSGTGSLSRVMTASDPPTQPAYGSRLLPQVLDDLAESKPERIFASIPKTFELKDGFRDVTVLQVSRSVNRLAWNIDGNIGRSPNFATIAYLGLPDLRYTVFFLAAIKCGYKVLFPSPRNTMWINASLLEQTECNMFFASPEMMSKAQSQKEGRLQLRILQLSTLDEMLAEDGDSEHYPFDKAFVTARWDPIVVLHSSGSTGAPKPIVMCHATFAVVDNDRNLPTVPGRRNLNFSLWNFGEDGGFFFSSFPPFHLGGFMAFIVLPIYSSESSLVLGPANKPSTGQTAAEVMRRFNLKALFCPPNIFEQLLQEPEALEHAKKLDFVMYAGGPLTKATGTALSKVTDVCQFYGSTETVPVQTLVPLREDWDTLEWHPLFGADMRPSVDDAYELVLHRDSKYEGIRGFDCNFPTIDEWPTKDLFRPDPVKPKLWRFHGRLDDIIVLSNGEKFNPVPSEAIINSHPSVSAALIIGQGRFQVALLIEPVKSDKSQSNLIDEIWPTVEKANAQAQSHGRIIRPMIVIADFSKSFERAGKGTVIRKLTAEKFSEEIAALYSEEEARKIHGGPKLDNLKAADSVQDFVRQAVAFSFPMDGVKASDDLYVRGLDSLKTMEVIAVLRAGLGEQEPSWLSSQTLYANPTVERLAKHIFRRLRSQSEGHRTSVDVEDKTSDRAALVAEYIQKYTNNLNMPVPNRRIVLTGSTGSLGRRLLRQLLASSHVTQIYCFDRIPNASTKHSDTLADHNLSSPQNKARVDFLQVDYTVTDFGLSAERHQELLGSVDIIIHTAWKVDFNHSLETFEPTHIRGVRHLVDWQLHSGRAPKIIFVSSTSSVSRWPTLGNGRASIPEHFLEGTHIAQAMGYAESKNVAEHILHEACKIDGISSTILRVGQIAGPLTSGGKWNEDEWVPALIKSSKSLGCLPTGLPDVDWIPVDSLASIIAEISVSSTRSPGASFFNLVNPNPTPWNSLLHTLQRRLGCMETVTLQEWIARLQRLDANDPKTVAQYPAIKILDFFHSLLVEQDEFLNVRYDTQRGVAASETMAHLPAIGPEAMNVWLDQWGY
ncbi:MAG: hypothetical protein Q9216_005528 [Gyalolechia sp. 2 TL-2023]